MARSLSPSGRLYFRDAEVEHIGLERVVKSAIETSGLQITHKYSSPQTKGFEFVASK